MNYIERGFLHRNFFIYVDCNKYYADNIFMSNNVKVRYRKELKYNEKYKIMFVSTNKLNDYLFVKSMYELEEKMEEKGYDDYTEICEEVISKMTKQKKKVKHV